MSAGRCKVDMSDGHQYLLVGVKATAIGILWMVTSVC